MKCNQAKPLLTELVYDQLADDVQSAVQEHLAGCETCRTEWQQLASARRHLDLLHTEPASGGLDLLPLFESARRRVVQSRSRWRRAAVAAGLAAAVLIGVAVSSVHVVWQGSQVSIAWGQPPTTQERLHAPVPPQNTDPRPGFSSLEVRLVKLEELTNLATREFLQTDQQRSVQLVRLHDELASLEQSHARRLEHLQAQADERWTLLLNELSLIRQEERFAQAAMRKDPGGGDRPFAPPNPQY